MTPVDVITDSARRGRFVQMLSTHAKAVDSEVQNLLLMASHWDHPNRHVVELGHGYVYDGKVYVVMPGLIVVYDGVDYCLRARIKHKKGAKA